MLLLHPVRMPKAAQGRICHLPVQIDSKYVAQAARDESERRVTDAESSGAPSRSTADLDHATPDGALAMLDAALEKAGRSHDSALVFDRESIAEEGRHDVFWLGNSIGPALF